MQLARLVVAELERVYNHLGDMAAASSAAGWAVGFARGLTLKEEAMRLNEAAAGHRLLFDAIVPGGVRAGVLEGALSFRAQAGMLEEKVKRYLADVLGNASLTSRWRDTGVLSKDVAVAFGTVGPAHRASQGMVDVRAFAPYGAYEHIPVRVAAAHSGDALGRCQVKASSCPSRSG